MMAGGMEGGRGFAFHRKHASWRQKPQTKSPRRCRPHPKGGLSGGARFPDRHGPCKHDRKGGDISVGGASALDHLEEVAAQLRLVLSVAKPLPPLVDDQPQRERLPGVGKLAEIVGEIGIERMTIQRPLRDKAVNQRHRRRDVSLEELELGRAGVCPSDPSCDIGRSTSACSGHRDTLTHPGDLFLINLPTPKHPAFRVAHDTERLSSLPEGQRSFV